jgi:hypothetical protein
MTGTDIIVDGGWFSSAPYLINARRNHMLTLLKRRGAVEDFLRRIKKVIIIITNFKTSLLICRTRFDPKKDPNKIEIPVIIPTL